MNKENIIFCNKPFMATKNGGKEELIKFTPVVYKEGGYYGVGVIFDDGDGWVWILKPKGNMIDLIVNNIISAWRGTEVLRHFGNISYIDLCYAFYVGVRNPYIDIKRFTKPIITEIGLDEYEKIMKTSVPEGVVKIILNSRRTRSDVLAMEDEIMAGTIQWRQEFSASGIKHPGEIDYFKEQALLASNTWWRRFVFWKRHY